jgi:hypothetical protein
MRIRDDSGTDDSRAEALKTIALRVQERVEAKTRKLKNCYQSVILVP